MEVTNDQLEGVCDAAEWVFGYCGSGGWTVEDEDNRIVASLSMATAGDMRFAVPCIPALSKPETAAFAREAVTVFCADVAEEMKQGSFEEDDEIANADFPSMNDNELAEIAWKAARLHRRGASPKRVESARFGVVLEGRDGILTVRLFAEDPDDESRMTPPVSVPENVDVKGVGADLMKKFGDQLHSPAEPKAMPTMM